MTEYKNFLAIDTSSKHLTVLAQKGEKVVLRFIQDCALSHSVTLMGEIDKAMEEAQLSPNECDFFCAVTGPGSFTGIRIGIATAKGLAMGAGKKLLGVTAFDLIAYNVKCEKFVAVIDAAHNHYYASVYDGERCTLAPCYLSEEEVALFNLPVFGIEDLHFENYTKLEVQNLIHPTLCRIERPLTDDIYALYVRKSQAEEGRK
ncbi:MAG: tRNA (adenosine(37)-N6)-threonylcarbamoyltransferase complex dimerization subunit type 1 TsaB [Clostridiales bacterium]|nr:tRNA (adenosine(37)-N6)-threonylcarbamoyltransferase complex dimerization subunit type 1 TsaB [Clostridiales bacterium]